MWFTDQRFTCQWIWRSFYVLLWLFLQAYVVCLLGSLLIKNNTPEIAIKSRVYCHDAPTLDWTLENSSVSGNKWNFIMHCL